MHLSEIYLYPVKSCAGYPVQHTRLDRFGPAGDRRWMLVDSEGEFMTQRSHPRMCLIRTTSRSDLSLGLVLGDHRLEVAMPGEAARTDEVGVWGQRVSARYAGDEADTALSAFLGVECHLVHMPESSRRPVDTDYAAAGETVGFADGFPLLLISQASLDALNERLGEAVPMNRFRPNLVVDGCEPFAEDSWRQIRIGSQELTLVKPCSRCVMPSIDQSTAERDPHILRALAAFRRVEGVVYFGQNLLYSQHGELAVGASVEVIR